MRTHFLFRKFLPLIVMLMFILFLMVTHFTSYDLRAAKVSIEERSVVGEDLRSQKIYTAKGEVNYEELDQKVFRPIGYRIQKASYIPTLAFLNEPTCEDVFMSWLSKSKSNDEAAPPPRTIPDELLKNYTLDGYSEIIREYMDDRSGSHSTTWSNIEDLMNGDPTNNQNYDGEGVAIYHAMRRFNLTGQLGFVIGSLSPWVEVFALQNGARKVLTLEYMQITVTNTDKVAYMHPVKLAEEYEKHVEQYDFAASFSSLEHSGLGRFGDVLDPLGDLRESLKAKCMLKKGGMFFLGFPVGQDTLHFNLHRIYGRLRLALMFAGFHLEATFYRSDPNPFLLSEEVLGKAKAPGKHIQCVFALRKL